MIFDAIGEAVSEFLGWVGNQIIAGVTRLIRSLVRFTRSRVSKSRGETDDKQQKLADRTDYPRPVE